MNQILSNKRTGEELSSKEKKQKIEGKEEKSSKATFQRVFGDFPPGLEYYSEFITKGEHDALIKHIDEGTWSNELKRRVQHFGDTILY